MRYSERRLRALERFLKASFAYVPVPTNPARSEKSGDQRRSERPQDINGRRNHNTDMK